MPNLLLQKPSKNSKLKDHQPALERCLELWHKGEFEELYFECKTIPTSLKTTQKPSSVAEISKKFKQYMAKGNTNSALNLLTNSMENEILALDNDTFSKLILKHLKGKTALQDILLNGDCNGTQTHNHIVHKRTLNHLAKLVSYKIFK